MTEINELLSRAFGSADSRELEMDEEVTKVFRRVDLTPAPLPAVNDELVRWLKEGL